jgi:hypothetical protein
MPTSSFKNALNDYVPVYSDKTDAVYNYYLFINDAGVTLAIREKKDVTDILVYDYATVSYPVDLLETGFSVADLGLTWTTWNNL